MDLRRTVSALATFSMLMGHVPLLRAASASTEMPVSVWVIARANVTVAAEPSIEVTDADVARGYVDVAAPVVLHGRTNSRAGYLLRVEKTSEEFSSIDLEFPNAAMTVAGHESWLRRPYVRGGEVLVVRARLYLAPGAEPGPHALPLSFRGSPL